MKLAQLIQKNVILPATLIGASLFGAQQANAQGFETDFDKKDEKKTEQKAEPTKNSNDLLDGYLRIDGHTSPQGSGVFGDLDFTIKPTRDFRVTINGLSAFDKYDGGDGEDLEVFSNRLMAGVGGYFSRSKDFELFGLGQIGFELDKFSNAVDLDGKCLLFGGKLGMASETSGTRVLLSGYGGKGKSDYELLSGFEGDGKFDRFYVGLETSQRLFGKGGKKTGFESEINQTSLGDHFESSLYLALEAFMQRDQLADLQTADGFGARASLPYVLNLRKQGEDGKGNVYADGWLFRFAPGVEFKKYDTTSDLSERTTESLRVKPFLRVEAEYNRWIGMYAEGGYEFGKLSVDDPGMGIDSKEDKNGFSGNIGIYVKW